MSRLNTRAHDRSVCIHPDYRFFQPKEKAAEEQAITEKPDLIFTDLNMPGISGIDLSRAIRQLHKQDQLPIIMITTQNAFQDRETAPAAGINAVLHKPFNEQTLATVIEKYLPGILSALRK